MAAVLGLGAMLSCATPSSAQSSLIDLGSAVGGQRVRLDLDSIQPVSDRSVDFTYYLGNDARYSQANCANQTWTTFENGRVQSPQSGATAEMLRIVCGEAELGMEQVPSWQVFAPPSNVRTSPNGAVQCVVRAQRWIHVYRFNGEWALTDACGDEGYIHRSQIRR